MAKQNCHMCQSYIKDNNINLDILHIKNIKIADTHPMCNICYSNDSYIDLTELLNQYDVDFSNFYLKIFLCDQEIYVLVNEWKDYLKNIFHRQNIDSRKNKIDQELKEYKLNNIIPSLRNAYIKFGYPDIDHVISAFRKKKLSKENRLYKLIKKLKKQGKKYDQNIPVYQSYINEGGNLKNIIEDSDLERSLIYNTNYAHYLKYNDTKTARYLATIEFTNSGKKDDVIDKFIEEKNTLKFF